MRRSMRRLEEMRELLMFCKLLVFLSHAQGLIPRPYECSTDPRAAPLIIDEQ